MGYRTNEVGTSVASGTGASLPSSSCSTCRSSQLCLPRTLGSEEINQFEEIVQRGRTHDKGDHIYREKTPFHSIYAVRLGCVKTFRLTNDGQEQVTGFYFPGEIIGIDGIAQNRYSNSAVCLETSALCEIPFDSLHSLSTKVPSLQRHFFQIMSQEIAADQQLITLLGKNSAEERVASLLASISGRMSERRLSATRFRLPMSRADIGNYLGLTVETVSRVISRFQKQGIIAVSNQEIEILDPGNLHRAAGESSDPDDTDN